MGRVFLCCYLQLHYGKTWRNGAEPDGGKPSVRPVFAGEVVSLWLSVAGDCGGDGGIRTLDRALQPYNGLANRRLQPLGHVSNTADMPDAAAARKRRFCAPERARRGRRLRHYTGASQSQSLRWKARDRAHIATRIESWRRFLIREMKMHLVPGK